MKPEKPVVPESLVAMWVFVGFAITAFIGYLFARGDGLDWYVSLPLPEGAIPAWAFGPATVLVAGIATYAAIKARRPSGGLNRPVFFLTWLTLGLDSVAELLLFGSRHSWMPAAIVFGIAALLCLIVAGISVGKANANATAAMMVILAVWLAWVCMSTLRTYKADKDSVPSATVTDVSGGSPPPPPAPRRM